MIDFSLTKRERKLQRMANDAARKLIRPIARYYDDYEHEHDEIKERDAIRQAQADIGMQSLTLLRQLGKEPGTDLSGIVATEEYYWGDAGVSLGAPNVGLGNAAIFAVGTKEQIERFGRKYTAMAITEPGAGSDSAAIRATAKLDQSTNEWVLNGEKIFVTGADRCEAVVVWASLDRSQGRAAIKSFVVEKGTPGFTLTKLENKCGIRASDTGSFALEDCRIPYDNILGTPEIKVKKGGFQGVMKTFDMTRPLVAIQAIGVARAALDFTKEKLEVAGYTFPYDRPLGELSVIQHTVLEMEANLEVARLLTYRAVAMMNQGLRNSLEASMSKAKAGRSATLVTQKCVALLGPLGYSREWLVEKWMRDSKITDLFEGTGQIQMLIIARTILGFQREQLK
ncbi:MAG: acyl-CoA dehydrogenase family protein [Deltaproteobacteria bacterium]|nr:acyl-CoA dehydrogenase family protein [Deltaproteobacteria bacterium]